MLRDPTSRGLYVRVWPPHTSERRGGGGGCEQEGWQSCPRWHESHSKLRPGMYARPRPGQPSCFGDC